MTSKEMELLCRGMNPCTREELHDTLAPCDDILFLTEYCKCDPDYKIFLKEWFFVILDGVYITYEPPYQGQRFTLPEMEALYNREVDKEEYTTFLGWLFDMRRSGIFEIEEWEKITY